MDDSKPAELTPEERERYAWQMDMPGFGGEDGQRKLKAATVLITRCGGLGGAVAWELAAAGIGRLILAHAGNLQRPDLNRQILMTNAWLGRPRVECAMERLREFNPGVDIMPVAENISPENAGQFVAEADVVVDAAPLFEERLTLNAACMQAGRPMVEAAMFGMEFSVTTFIPGITGCLACLVPETPAWWRRRFPVFGAVSGAAGCLAAMEVIKLLTGCGEPLAGRMLCGNTATNQFRTVVISRRSDCAVCGRE